MEEPKPPIRAEDVIPEDPDWLWRYRVPRKMISIVAGRPDQGKGLLCAHIAAEVSRTKFGDRYGQVLYSAIEDSYGIMTRPRLEAAGANLANVHLVRFQLPKMMDVLIEWIVFNDIDLVVIDPLNAHLGGGINRFSDNIRVVTNPLAEILEATDTACIVVEHVLKKVPQSGHPLQAIGGSGSGIVAASRMAFLFGSDPKDEERRILACVKHNICEKPPEIEFALDSRYVEGISSDVPFLVYKDETEFDAMKMLQAERQGHAGRPPDKRSAAAEWLTNYLYALKQPALAGKVFEDAKQYGFTTRTIRNAASDLKIVKNPPQGGRVVKWSLPDKIKELMDKAFAPYRESMPENPVVSDEPLLSDADYQALLGLPKDGDGKDGSS